MKKKLLLTMLTLAVSASMIVGGTMAWFTSEDDAGNAVFTAGVLNIDVSDGLTTFNDLLPVSSHGNMNPGDVYDEFEIVIENDGTKNLAWFGDWQFTPEEAVDDKLLDAIYIKTMGMQMLDENDELWDDNDPWYSGYNFIEDGRGNFVGHNQGEADAFDAMADESPFNVITLRNWNDNNGMITLSGAPFEHMGALKPGNKYVLTVQFGFHEGAGNEYQGNAAGVSPITVGFEVNSTQVVADAIDAEIAPTGLGTAHITWLENQLSVQP